MKGLSLSLRKGAWSKVEDDLLTACVQKYGEGKWHLVPNRAGLNRCRKSCRLRWLNYLKPSIKRGKFSEDEVDMMKRLHRLLGNRWSLIAGRLPGRTSNDVKNYWNTHLTNKKLSSSSHKEKIKNAMKKEIVKPNLVIKPQAWTFTSTIPPPWLKTMFLKDVQSGAKQCLTQSCAPLINDNCINVMEDKIGNIENDKYFLGIQDGMLIKDFNDDDDDDGGGGFDCLLEDESWNDILVDFNLWDS